MRKIEAAHTYHADYFADSEWQFDVTGSPHLTATSRMERPGTCLAPKARKRVDQQDLAKVRMELVKQLLPILVQGWLDKASSLL
jgi:hypothetical protein